MRCRPCAVQLLRLCASDMICCAGGGCHTAPVLPVPCARRGTEAHNPATPVVPCHLHAVDPRGHGRGCCPHGTGVAHRKHSEGALGAHLLPVQVRPPFSSRHAALCHRVGHHVLQSPRRSALLLSRSALLPSSLEQQLNITRHAVIVKVGHLQSRDSTSQTAPHLLTGIKLTSLHRDRP